METIGALLRSHRGARGQAEMAEKLGTSQANYSRWETDDTVPPPESWEAIRAVLGISRRSFGEALQASGEFQYARKSLRLR